MVKRFGNQDYGQKEPTSRLRADRAAVFAGEAQAGSVRPIAFQHRAGVHQTFAVLRAPGPAADETVQNMQCGPDDFVVVIAPGVRGDDAAAGVIPQRRWQRGLTIVHAEDDQRAESRTAFGQSPGIAALRNITLQVAHLAGAALCKPRQQEISMGCRRNGRDTAEVEAEARRLLLHGSSELLRL